MSAFSSAVFTRSILAPVVKTLLYSPSTFHISLLSPLTSPPPAPWEPSPQQSSPSPPQDCQPPPPSPLFSLVTHEAKEATSFAPQPHSPSSVSPSPHQHYLLEKWKRTVPARATSSSSFFLGTLTLLLLLSSLCLSSILLSSTMLDLTVLK